MELDLFLILRSKKIAFKNKLWLELGAAKVAHQVPRGDLNNNVLI
jgi:hypothetical protein